MIRDPSDGSVREPARCWPIPSDKPKIDSGLPIESKKPKDLARLERSREWLRKYRTDPESVVRRMGEGFTEPPSDTE